jgi:hypothetical protein
MIIQKTNNNYLLVENDRVFVQSKNINIFPCSRRGPYTDKEALQYYDPEARLNTERTNRLHTAINGFADSFIADDNFVVGNTLIFVLAGYYIEVKDFNPVDIAEALGSDVSEIYAHLSLHAGISLNVEDYTTEILYRQSTIPTDKNYLDVSHTDNNVPATEDFFVGISFTKEETEETVTEISLFSHNLKLFNRTADGNYEFEQTSLLPRIAHGETEDSIKIFGELAVSHLTVDNNLTVKKHATIDCTTKVNDTIIAEKLVITDTDQDGVNKGEIVTPQLRVNRITSNDGSITVDNKKLIVNRSLEILAKESATDHAKATIEQAIIGDLTVKVDPALKNSTGKITAKEISVEKITQNSNPVPAISLKENGTAYQLQITLDASKK